MRFVHPILVASVFFVSACSSSSSNGGGGGASSGGSSGTNVDSGALSDAVAPASYVLVHGAWMGAWAWTDVANALEATGAKVTVVQLPAHGDDTTAVAQASLDAYVATVTAALDHAASPSILVGHSFGGVVVTQAAEARPSRVAKLVYLAALLPQDGQSGLDVATKDADSHSGPILQIDATAGTVGLPADKLADVFCADCSPSALATLQSHYKIEPLKPLGTPVHTTAAGWGSVTKYFVYTKQDHAVSYTLQQAETAGMSFAGTRTLDTSHSPFLSAPDQLVSALTSIAGGS